MIAEDRIPPGTLPKDVTLAWMALRGDWSPIRLSGKAETIYRRALRGEFGDDTGKPAQIRYFRDWLNTHRGQRAIRGRPKTREEKEEIRRKRQARVWPPQQRSPFEGTPLEDIQKIADLLTDDPDLFDD